VDDATPAGAVGTEVAAGMDPGVDPVVVVVVGLEVSVVSARTVSGVGMAG